MSLSARCDFVFFFFKQKTAYEWRISDWSSDVCSSDLAGIMRVDIAANAAGDEPFGHRLERREQWRERALALLHQVQHRAPRRARAEPRQAGELLDERFDFGGGHAQHLSPRNRLHKIGRASGRARGWQYE